MNLSVHRGSGSPAGGGNKTLWVPVGNNVGLLGDWPVASTTSGARAYAFLYPDDFSSLVSAELLISTDTTGTLTYALALDFGNPDSNEAYNAGSDGASGLTLSTTANRLHLIDLASYLSGVAAGDFIGVSMSHTAGQTVRHKGLRLIYTPS